MSALRSVVLSLCVLLSACGGKKLPACNDEDVTSTFKEILQGGFKGLSIRLSYPGETRYRSDSSRRICRATTSITGYTDSILYYSVEWQDKEQGIFLVRFDKDGSMEALSNK